MVHFRFAFVHRVVKTTTPDTTKIIEKIFPFIFSPSLLHFANHAYLPLTASGDRMLQFVTFRVYQIEVHLSYEIRANRVRRIFKTIVELIVTVARQPVEKYFPFFSIRVIIIIPTIIKIITDASLFSVRKEKYSTTLLFQRGRRIHSIFTSDSCEVAAGQSRLQFARGLIARNFSPFSPDIRSGKIRGVGVHARPALSGGRSRAARQSPSVSRGMEPSRGSNAIRKKEGREERATEVQRTGR